MYKKSLGLCCLLFSNLLMASDLYTEQLVLSNKTPGLTIKFPSPVVDAGMPAGPTDATVIDNKFVVMDAYGSGVSFFDHNGALLKRIALPRGIQFENIVRDSDNSLFVFATDTEHTKVIHIQNEVITEQSVYRTTTRHYIDYIIPDEYGLIMMGSVIPPVRKKVEDGGRENQLLEETSIPFQDRIDRNCVSCEPKPVDGIQVGGLLYRITPGKNPAFFIGKKEIPLKLYQNFGINTYEIMQVDQDGTAWIDNSIMLNGPPLTYVWKVNKLGEVLGIYRFASDKETSVTQWLMQRQLIISNDGKVYGLISNKKQFKFVLLKPFSVEEMKLRAKELDSALFKKKESKSKKNQDLSQLQSENFLTVGCKLRSKVIDDAYDYMENKIYLSTSSIINDATCPNRIIPPYLLEGGGKAQTYDSVSYNWGGFDTIAEFNNKILTNKMKAGNVNDKTSLLLACAAGVDCSGYVSRAWGLASKLGTWDIASDQITEEIDWNEMKPGDVYIVPGVHVMLYRMKDDFFGRKVVIAESNAEKGKVLQQKIPITWLQQLKYQPRRVKSNIVCKAFK